jgi:fructosamine-3-kinase
VTRQPLVASKAEALLDASVIATAPLAGGDIATATKLRLSNGATALMKTLPHAPDDFFEVEAAGLRWLGEVDGGVHVPEVLGVDHECLVISWVEPGKNGVDAAAAFGRALATTHAAGAPSYGWERDGFIGKLPMPNRTAQTWAEFYATRRILPYLKLARDRDAITEEEAATVESVVPRLEELVPEESPSRLHGDLWNGNVLWGQDPTGGSPAVSRVSVIDPAAYAGHREVDLAMLAMFGLPHLPRVIDAYCDTAPLADGWEERVGLHQLFPLLVHACLFRGGYGARAAATAAKYV